MSPYSVSGAFAPATKRFLDIIGAYVSAAWGKSLLFFLLYAKKVGVRYPYLEKVGGYAGGSK